MREPIAYEDMQFQDCMRLFKGDGPSIQFEGGNNAGGDNFCPVCNVHVNEVPNYMRVIQHEYTDLHDVTEKITRTEIGRRQCGLFSDSTFEGLDRVDLEKELKDRDVNCFRSQVTPKADLEDMLKKSLCGKNL